MFQLARTFIRPWCCRLLDRQINHGVQLSDERVLVLRHPNQQPYRWNFFFRWMQQRFPELRRHFEFGLLPFEKPDLSRYRLLLPLMQDPVADWSPQAYFQAMDLAMRFERRGTPVVNRPDRASHSVKSIGSKLIASTGVRTPRIFPLDRLAKSVAPPPGFDYPFLIREDRGHVRPSSFIGDIQDWKQLRLDTFENPIASEFIDVRNQDGMFRKYRYLVAGSRGVTRHLIVGSDWEVRPNNRVLNEATIAEELAYLRSVDPNHAELHAAAKALEFDLAAFDYSYDQAGELVIWEANPFPDMKFVKRKSMDFRAEFDERSVAAVAAMLCEMAELDLPNQISDWLAPQMPIFRRCVA